jgi:predicted peptidase
LLYLHGSGARGVDLDPQRLGGPASLIADGKSLPMIVVSPQCPVDCSWEAERLRQLLEHLQTHFQPQRVVVTGYSMGGGGTWEFAQTYPELVDGAAPVCGCGEPAQAKRLKDVPVWAFHGALDDVIPIRCSRGMVEAIEAAGGTAKLTTFPEHGHGISRTVYDNPKFYRWVLDPRRPAASPSTGAAAP